MSTLENRWGGKKKLFWALVVGVLFFIFALFTLSDYGISWDEPTHFKRGQGYLWYLLTRDNDYRKLPPYDLSRAQNDPWYHERSIYQDDKHNAAFYRTIDGAHPPLADIFASASNMIFYQKLGWLGDIESYHLFEIFVASLGVAVLFLFVHEGFGFLPAVFSTVFYATYPLFWAESHFNIKDPIETTWIIVTLYFLWKGVKSSSARLLFASSVFAGFALGTKFNVIFLPLIVFPWLVLVFKSCKKEFVTFLKTKSTIFVVFLYPVIVFAIFYLSYPFLWDNPIINIGKVLTYYQRNALDPAFANAVLPSWSFYALRWVVLTSPPLVLLGLVLSLIFLKNLLFKNHGFVLLAFLWLVVPIVRVSIPGINIYGGVRQIMEYIPAMAILAGIGASSLIEKLKVKYQQYNPEFKNFWVFDLSFCILIFAFSVYPLVKLHPNENVYFNFIAGGLRGAVESGVPAAGNSFGNAYYQGLPWINKNAAPGAKLTLIQGSAVNIPAYKLRSDIDLSGDYFSGIGHNGEYLMALTFNYEHKENFYAWEYVDKFLKPLFEVKVDGVSILKVWKNDLEHTELEYKLEEKIFDGNITMSKERNEIKIEMEDEIVLSKLVFYYDPGDKCSLPASATVETSLDGKVWVREKDPLTFSQVGKKGNSFRPAWDSSTFETTPPTGSITFYFAGRKAKFIRLVLDNEKSCVLNNPIAQVRVLVP